MPSFDAKRTASAGDQKTPVLERFLPDLDEPHASAVRQCIERWFDDVHLGVMERAIGGLSPSLTAGIVERLFNRAAIDFATDTLDTLAAIDRLAAGFGPWSRLLDAAPDDAVDAVIAAALQSLHQREVYTDNAFNREWIALDRPTDTAIFDWLRTADKRAGPAGRQAIKRYANKKARTSPAFRSFHTSS